MENKPLWTITRVLEWTKQYFANKGIENPRLDAEILLCAVLKCERITLYVHLINRWMILSWLNIAVMLRGALTRNHWRIF